MTRDSAGSRERVSRRSVLAAGAASLSFAVSGCADLLRDRLDDGALSLTLMTVPDDNDRQAVQLARQLEANLVAAGVDVTLEFRSRTELMRSVLLEHDFDVYVDCYPERTDPDVLYELLHSSYANEIGWQNPYGYAHLGVDELLEEQRRAVGGTRRELVADLLETVAAEVPLIPVCVPDDYRAYAPDRFSGWDETRLRTGLGYLGIEPVEADDELTATVTDSRRSRNVNPFAPEYRDDGLILGLLFDSLGVEGDGEVVSWLAESWERVDGGGDEDGGGVTFEVRLREDLSFHDGEPLTAEDVAFTYRFLTDTADGRTGTPLPPPRFRRHGAAIERVIADDDRTLLVMADVAPEIVERAFTVPVLPEHVWAGALEEVEEFPSTQRPWGLLESSDDEFAIGSGPFELVERSDDDGLTLERFDDHFTLREDVDRPSPTVAEFDVRVDPGSASAVEGVENEAADITASRLETHVIDEARRRSNVELLEAPPGSFYQIGFNARRMPCSNPRFRRIVARMIDREWLIDEVFDGYARPTLVPVAEQWAPESLAWEGEDPVTPFLGEDGKLDVEAAREAFLEAGFQYDENWNLRVRG